MASLPFLPGNSFSDPTKGQFHRNQTLKYTNGYALPKKPVHGIGGASLPANEATPADLEVATTKPSLTYGQAQPAPPQDFIPAHVAFDKKVLLFDAYFKQTVHESPNEFYRIRPVKIYYYLEDDSISVVEPVVPNSGIPQGKLIKRQRLPKNDLGQFWHWKDFNLGLDVTFYGKVFHVCNCNKFTEEFMSSEGILLNPGEEILKDPYAQSRRLPVYQHETPSSFDKLKQFLQMDRKVLRFYCLWDDRDAMFGEIRPCILHYYLVDDAVEIREVHEPNDGRDPFPVLLRRQKLPKNRDDVKGSFPACVLEMTEHEVQAWFSPADFAIGRTLFMNGRKFLIYDCDEFTKQYYFKLFGIQGMTPIDIKSPKAREVALAKSLPPYNGFGSHEDSMQNCLSLIPQPPKKDFIKILENDGKILRFSAIMDSSRPEDANRKFIISYRLADDMMQIYEPPQRNAGILGGKFLERTRVPKPGSHGDEQQFYSPADLAIGALVAIFKHKFIITDADEYVLKWMEENSEVIPEATIASLKQKHGK
eukprot:m.308823 g.308823  ORF g.308823 m.308823 type:complete len:534 (+) comp44928_c0_seq1:29-1630(+)